MDSLYVLMKNRDPISKYEQGRAFEIDGDYVVEKGTNWKGKIETKY